MHRIAAAAADDCIVHTVTVRIVLYYIMGAVKRSVESVAPHRTQRHRDAQTSIASVIVFFFGIGDVAATVPVRRDAASRCKNTATLVE